MLTAALAAIVRRMNRLASTSVRRLESLGVSAFGAAIENEGAEGPGTRTGTDQHNVDSHGHDIKPDVAGVRRGWIAPVCSVDQRESARPFSESSP